MEVIVTSLLNFDWAVLVFCRVVALSRWCYALKEPEANDFLKTYFGIRYNLIVPFVSKGVYKQARAQGIGRHTKAEALSLAEDDLRAISKFLGTATFDTPHVNIP